MVRLKNINRTDDFIECDYYPEGEAEGGFLKLSLENFEVIENRMAPFELDRMHYRPHFHRAKNRLIKIANENPLPREQLVMWY